MSIRPITDTLRLLDSGAFLDAVSDKMSQLVRRVEETGRAGALTITLDVKRASAGGAMAITPSVALKIPEPKPDATLLWATVEGNLSVDNPNQQTLDLRQVEPASREVREVPSGAGPLKAAG
jgi:hypothetical protein